MNKLKRMRVMEAYAIEFSKAGADQKVVLSSMMRRYLGLRKELTDVIEYAKNDKKTIFGNELIELFTTLLFTLDNQCVDIVVEEDSK